MQTFVPYDSFASSAMCLDRQRLGKQRVETLQILNALTGHSAGWVNHPATNMWRGHESGLCAYGISICAEWTKRGYKDTCTEKMLAIVTPDYDDLPFWWGDPMVHSSHRSNLLRKDPAFYSQWNWDDDPAAPYIWPVASMR